MPPSRRPNPGALWIGGPWIDLCCFAFAWIPAFAAFVALDRAGLESRRTLLLLSILAFNFVHRHLTFPLVYGDPDQFGRRRLAYVALPPFFLGLTLAMYFWSQSFFVLETLAILWTLYHVVMQKVGLLRIYSRKSGATRLWLDKLLPLAWLGALALHGVASPSLRGDVTYIFQIPAALNATLDAAEEPLRILAWLALSATALLTIVYVRDELSRPRVSWPKLVYALSIGVLYAIFYYDLGVGYAVFSFSHAVEYIVFVNLYSRKKYLGRPPGSSMLARAARHQGAAMLGYVLVVVPAFVFWNQLAPVALHVYIVGSGFLHFIYDGWIWKTRDQSVGRPLGISYAGETA